MPSPEGKSSLRLLRFSLVFVWLATALVSVVEIDGQGRELLQQAGLSSPGLAHGVIAAGAAVDALLGLAMALRPGRFVYAAALIVMVVMTVVATVLLPALWLHPLGPLTKNIPLAACLWVLLQQERKP